jgi:hypothetical protein
MNILEAVRMVVGLGRVKVGIHPGQDRAGAALLQAGA